MQEARRLSDITNEFYRTVRTSFSATRQSPWAGWERVAEVAFPGNSGGRASDSRLDGTTGCGRPFDVLDLACGNLRFERFLGSQVPNARVWAADICDELAEVASTDDLPKVYYQHVDLASDPTAVDAPACDLCVSFGFMHHLPTVEQRMAVLRTLVEHTRAGGFVAVSFWQFVHDERLRAKATPLEEPGDYLMGWQHEQGVHRYCHNFEENEIDALVASLPSGMREVERFSADGKSGDLNRYVILCGTRGGCPKTLGYEPCS